jgi:transcriptional regulator ATRX
MVSFAKPNLLGTLNEFKNRFVNPILAGQHADSSEFDVFFMKKRAHILHTTLEGCVQRKDYEVIKSLLPAKHEYAVFVRLSNKQCDLYRRYLERESFVKPENNGYSIKGAQLFQDFYNLSRVCMHPWVLKIQSEKEKDEILKNSHRRIDNFMRNESDCENKNPKKLNKSKTGKTKKDAVDLYHIENKSKWWNDLVDDDCEFDTALSGKMAVLEELLKKCDDCGDKLLLFSQRLTTLDFIEKYLKYWSFLSDKKSKSKWIPNVDYCRIDGSTDGETRKDYINGFNNYDNYRMRLFLISTKAGGMGINLVGANRVVIFDASWNVSTGTLSLSKLIQQNNNFDLYQAVR